MGVLIPRPNYPPYGADNGDAGRAEADKLLAECERRVYLAYEEAAVEMKRKANEYLKDFVKEDNRRRKLVEDGEMDADDYKRWRLSHIAQGRRWFQFAAVLAADLANTNEYAAGIINGYMPDVFAIGANYGLYQGELSGGIDTSFTLYDRETVMRLIGEEPELLPIEAKLNRAESMQWDTKQLASTMTQAIMQGERIENIAERLVATVAGMDEKTAIRNARTAFTSAENGGRYNSYRRLSGAGVNLTIEWCATLDGRTRHTHRLLDGIRRRVDQPFEVDGQKILYAGDPNAPQGLVWNCRCTMLCFVEGFEVSRTLKESTRPDNMSYRDWKGTKVKEYEKQKSASKNKPNPDNPAY